MGGRLAVERTWQGKLVWVEGGRSMFFRSAPELLHLLQSAAAAEAYERLLVRDSWFPGPWGTGDCTPHFLFVLPKRKRAVHGPKEKGALRDPTCTARVQVGGCGPLGSVR